MRHFKLILLLCFVSLPSLAWDSSYNFVVTNSGDYAIHLTQLTMNYTRQSDRVNFDHVAWTAGQSLAPHASVILAGADVWPANSDPGGGPSLLTYVDGDRLNKTTWAGANVWVGTHSIAASGIFNIKSTSLASAGGATNVTVFLTNGTFVVSEPMPVTLTDFDSPNVFPAFKLGMGFGLTVCGFGWVLRLARRVTGPDNS